MWNTEENFDESYSRLRNALNLNDSFNIQHILNTGGCYLNDKILYFPTILGSRKNVNSVVHEISHFLISDFEYVFLTNWGLRHPYKFFTGIGIDPLPSRNDCPIKFESKVWAIEHLIEVMTGFRDIDNIKEHDEVVFVDNMKYLNRYDEIKNYTKTRIEKEVKELLKINYKKLILDKIKKFPSYIQQNDCYLSEEHHILKERVFKINDNDSLIQIVKNNGWYQVLMTNTDPDYFQVEEVHISRDYEKAEKYFSLSVKLNEEYYV